MRKKLFPILLLLLIATGCSKSNRQQFENAGGSIRLCLENEPFTYIARDAGDYYSATVLKQSLEGLVKIDTKTTKIEGLIAKSWEISDDGLTYTFIIRDDILFHPHPVFKNLEDRRLTVDDIVKSAELMCTKDPLGNATNGYSLVFKGTLQGANDYFDGKATTISGLSTKDNTVIFKLTHKDDNFLYKLASIQASIISEKIHDAGMEAEVIGTGPFIYKAYKTGDTKSILFIKNPEYYGQDEQGNYLPYLDSLEFFFESRKLEELDLFEQQKIDMILGLPTSRITKMLEGRIEDFNSKPPKMHLFKNALLITNYYLFNMKDPRFENPKVRMAFNYAVNKEKIGREVLRNQYDELGYYGIVPPISSTFRGYDFKKVKSVGYDFDPALAKRLLKEAGYPNGEGFGSVNLRFNIGDVNSAVADEFAQQIFQTLNINVNIDGSTFEQLDKDASFGNGDIFRSAWGADYPNPETFLNNFYGKHIPTNKEEPSKINPSRYSNPVFDNLFEQALLTDKVADKMDLFSKSEVALMKDPPIIPLWYNGDMQIVYSYVRNFHFNALNIFDFRTVYKKAWTLEEYQQSIQE